MSNDINEVNSKLLELYNMSHEELNKHIIEGNFVVSNAVDYKELTLCELADGWELFHSKPKHNSDEVILFIIPKTDATKRIWDVGQFKVARNAGLSSRQTRRWIRIRSKYKYDLLPALVDIVSDEALIKALVNYSTEMTTKEYHAWFAEYNFQQYEDRFWYKYSKERIKQLLVKIIAETYIKSITESSSKEEEV